MWNNNSIPRLSNYDLGESVSTACQHDQRFSYCSYVPPHFNIDNAEKFRLMVAIHGSDRANQQLRGYFKQFADTHNAIILAPLFPAGIGDPQDVDNYKHILFSGIRFDQILLHMVSEVESKYGLTPGKFGLFGFSGGGHFCHRFLYLHPEKLLAVAIAAPGSVTLISDNYNWWVGTANIEKLFGKPLDLQQIRNVPILLSVGEEDTSTNGIVSGPDSAAWMEGAGNSGANRIERLQSLYRNFNDYGFKVDLTILPGVRHEIEPHAKHAQNFLAIAFG